jgi:hypothetical protein
MRQIFFKKIKITKFFGDVNAPLRALYYLTITTFMVVMVSIFY